MTDAEIQTLRTLTASVTSMCATIQAILDHAAGVKSAAQPEPEPERPRYFGDDEPPARS